MGLADKLIARIEQQAQALDSYRQLDDQRRARIYDLEVELVNAVAGRNAATEERSHALIDVSQKELELQDTIAAGELMKAENETLRQQLAEARQPEVDAKRLRDFADKIRDADKYKSWHVVELALAELDAGTEPEARQPVLAKQGSVPWGEFCSSTEPEGGK